MRILFFSILILQVTNVFSANPAIKMNILLKSKGDSEVNSTLIVQEGKEGSLTKNNANRSTTISAIPTYADLPEGGRGIKVDFKINANGKVMAPQILVKEGAKASFSLSSPENEKELELEIVANTVKEKN